MNLKIKPTSKKELFDEDNKGSDSSSSSESENDETASSSDSSESHQKLTVNKKYAKEYQDRKQREELRQIAQQRREIGLGSDDEDDDGSSDEEEDEDGRLLTDSVNLQFLKTIKALKNKDSSIYDPKARFFEDVDEESDGNADATKRKPKKFKDILRDQILEDMEKEKDDHSSEGEKDKTKELSKSKFAYDDQQEELRKAFLKETNDESSDQEEDWMVMKSKTKPVQNDKKEAEIQEEFKVLEELTSKKKETTTFSDPRGEVKDGEKFLIEFMKNKKWMDKEEFGDQDMDDASRDKEGQGDESSIEDLDRADDFEAQYNFRYEQAAAETAASGATLSIQTFARGQTMNTLRRQDATRKDKRQARKERKEAERKAKEEQLKRLKNAKRQEIEKKLSQVKAVIGAVDEKAIDEAAILKMLEGDYDPEQFEKAMQEAYGDDFYQKEDPEWKSDIDVRHALQNDEEVHDVVGQDDADGGLYDDEMAAHDEEADAGNWEEEDENEEYVGGDDTMESELEKKIKNKLQEELYKLDYEDIVAGMPTRFKYRQVEPNDYGLTTHEILLARDTTLKQYVSLKKLAPYNEAGEHFVSSRKRRRFREMLKQDLMEQVENGDPPQEEEDKVQDDGDEHEEQTKKKRRRLKKGKKKTQGDSNEEKSDDIESSTKPTNDASDPEKPQKKRRKKGRKSEGNAHNANDTTPLTSENLEPRANTPEPVSHKKERDEREGKKKKNKKSKKAVASLPKSRLASYGL
jgi:protein KRI1